MQFVPIHIAVIVPQNLVNIQIELRLQNTFEEIEIQLFIIGIALGDDWQDTVSYDWFGRIDEFLDKLQLSSCILAPGVSDLVDSDRNYDLDVLDKLK